MFVRTFSVDNNALLYYIFIFGLFFFCFFFLSFGSLGVAQVKQNKQKLYTLKNQTPIVDYL